MPSDELTKEQEAALAAYCRVVAAWNPGEPKDIIDKAAWQAGTMLGCKYDRDRLRVHAVKYAGKISDRLAAAERDTATLLEIIGEHLNPWRITSEDAETLNRIRHRAKVKG